VIDPASAGQLPGIQAVTLNRKIANNSPNRCFNLAIIRKSIHLGSEIMAQEESNLPKLASPAQRALAGAGITQLVQLTRMSEKELLQLHGIGPNAIKTLRLALQEKGLSFLSDKNG